MPAWGHDPTGIERLIEIQHSEPSPAMVGLAGNVTRGRRLGAALLRATGVTDPARPHVVYEADGVVGRFNGSTTKRRNNTGP